MVAIWRSKNSEPKPYYLFRIWIDTERFGEVWKGTG